MLNPNPDSRKQRIVQMTNEQARRRRADAGAAGDRPRGAGAPRARRGEAEVDLSDERGLRGVRMGEVETIEYTRDRGLSLTVYFGTRKASASTADLDQLDQPPSNRPAPSPAIPRTIPAPDWPMPRAWARAFPASTSGTRRPRCRRRHRARWPCKRPDAPPMRASPIRKVPASRRAEHRRLRQQPRLSGRGVRHQPRPEPFADRR